MTTTEKDRGTGCVSPSTAPPTSAACGGGSPKKSPGTGCGFPPFGAPDTSGDGGTRDGTLGLYLHIPFCRAKCRYCDFYSAPADDALRARYVDALCAHLAAWAPRAAGRRVETVYFGGGTPNLLTPSAFSALMGAIRRHYDLSPAAEITAECNPGGGAPFEALRAAGVNRVSLGVQSLCDGELRLLGRIHTAEEARGAFAEARRAGFDNISTDVMFGIPAHTPASFAATLDELTALGPDHISAYELHIEPGTPFYEMRNTLSLPTEDEAADLWEMAAARLTRAGYTHYEISNYAKPGRMSRHNLRYWQRREVLGFGPGAHSFFAGVRFETPRDTAGYLAASARGDFAALAAHARRIQGREAREESVMLRMRLFAGLDEGAFTARWGVPPAAIYGPFDRLEAGGFLTRAGGRLAFTERGMAVSNQILSDWLDFPDPSPASKEAT